MAVGFSPQLPLQPDSVDGFYKLNKTLGDVAKQNMKTIVLTAPGERIMHPDFGVGARNYLFDTSANAYQSLNAKIIEQVRRYLPFVEIINVSLADVNADEIDVYNNKDTQYMGLQIVYYISNLNLSDTLKIVVSRSN